MLLQEFFVNKKLQPVCYFLLYIAVLKLIKIVKFSIPIDGIRKIFKTLRVSEKGSKGHEKEQNSYMMFLDYLDECEKGMYSTIVPSV